MGLHGFGTAGVFGQDVLLFHGVIDEVVEFVFDRVGVLILDSVELPGPVEPCGMSREPVGGVLLLDLTRIEAKTVRVVHLLSLLLSLVVSI